MSKTELPSSKTRLGDTPDETGKSGLTLKAQGYRLTHKDIEDLKHGFVNQLDSKRHLSFAPTDRKEGVIMLNTVGLNNAFVYSGSYASISFTNIKTKETTKLSLPNKGTACIRPSKNTPYILHVNGEGLVRKFNPGNTSDCTTLLNLTGLDLQTALITHDEKYLIYVNSSSVRCQVYSLETRTYKGALYLENMIDPIEHIRVTTDDRYLFAGGQDKSVRVWDLKEMKHVHFFQNCNLGSISYLTIAPDNNTVYAACSDGTISILNFEKRQVVHSFLNCHSDDISGLLLLKNNKVMVSTSWDGSMSLWDVEAKVCLHKFENFGYGPLLHPALTSDDKYVIASSHKEKIVFLDLGGLEDTTHVAKANEKIITRMIATDDGLFIASADIDGYVNVYNIETKERVHSFRGARTDDIYALCTRGKKIGASGTNGTIDVWDTSTGDHFAYEEKHNECFDAIKITPDESKLVVTGHVIGFWIFDLNEKKLIAKVTHETFAWNFSMEVTKDSKYAIFGGKNRTISIWDIEPATPVFVDHIPFAHDSTMSGMTLTNDNKYLLTSASEPKVKMWDFQKRELVYVFTRESFEQVTTLCVTRDDNYVISVDFKCYIEIHSLTMKQRVFRFNQLAGKESRSMAVAPNGKEFYFTVDKALHSLDNPFTKVTVSTDKLPSDSWGRFTPLTSFLGLKDMEQKRSLIRAYSELNVQPYGWNWFHIVAIFAPHNDLFMECFENNILFGIDLNNRTPFHYLLSLHSDLGTSMLDFLLSKFDVILARFQRPAEFIDSLSDIFFDLLSLDNKNVVAFLRQSFVEPMAAHGESIDIYGTVKNSKRAALAFSDSILYSKKLTDSLVKPPDATSSKQRVLIKSLPYRFDYSHSSKSMKAMVTTLLEMNYDEVFSTKAVELIIKHLWDSSRSFYTFLISLFSVQAILISVYSGLGEADLGLEIPIFVIAMLFLIYEAFELVSEGFADYFSSFWNWIDISTDFLIPATIICVWCEAEEETKDWLMSFVLALTYIRWISFFRMFKQTRKLIRMIIEIFKDIISFVVILVFIIFGLSLIFLQFDRETSFQSHLLNSYRLLYSDFDLDTFEASAPMLFYFVIIMIMVSIVLLNMLIAIMGATFERVQERSLLVDNKEILELIKESIKIRRAFKKLFTKKATVHAKKEETGKYLFFIQQGQAAAEEEFSNDLDEKVKQLSENLEKTNNQVALKMKFVEDQVKQLSKQNASQFEVLDKQVKTNNTDQLNLLKTLQEMFEKVLPKPPVQPAPEPQKQAEPAPQTQTQPPAQAQAESQPQAQAPAPAQTQQQPQTQSQSQPQAQAQVPDQTQTQAQTQPQTQAPSQPDGQAQAQTQP